MRVVDVVIVAGFFGWVEDMFGWEKRRKKNRVGEGTKWVWLVSEREWIELRWGKKEVRLKKCVCGELVVLLDGYVCYVIFSATENNATYC